MFSYVVINRHNTVTRLLLEKGAIINTEDKQRLIALYYATMNGVKVNRRDNKDYIAL
jgi:ankyrin repeat protein